MTPGEFLCQARVAKGWTHEDLALRLETEPAVSCRRRAELLNAIEHDLVRLSPGQAIVLHQLLDFDAVELERIWLGHQDGSPPPLRFDLVWFPGADAVELMRRSAS